MNVNEELEQALKEVTEDAMQSVKEVAEEAVGTDLTFINPKCERCWTGRGKYEAGNSICYACSALDIYDTEAFQIIDSFSGTRDPHINAEYLEKALLYPDIDIHLLAAIKDAGECITDECTPSRLQYLNEEQYNSIQKDVENYVERADNGEFDRVEISMKIVRKDVNVDRSITVPIPKEIPVEVALYNTTLSISDDIMHDLKASLNK